MLRKMAERAVQLVGFLAGALTTIAFIPQVLRTWRTRSTEDLSLAMLVVFNIGVALWLVYGIALREPPMMLWNAATLPMSISLLVLKLRHRDRPPQNFRE
jgi:MtN3 and saliva related transmembrane protein